MKTEVLFSRQSDEWATPQELFDELDREFHFNLDPCATEENHKCEKYFTKEDDGRKKSWGGAVVFCNPPYSEIDKWVQKAWYESRQDNTVVVLLIPARTDTRYFHNYILNRAEVRFVKGRITFGEAKNHAPFPSMIVIFRGAEVK